MKKYFIKISIVISLLLISCNKPEKESLNSSSITELTENDKYELHFTQKDADDFKVYILNKLNGNVFVRLNNGACYLAENKLPKPEYEVPTYSFKIMNGKDGYDQIILLDKLTGEVQIMSYSNSWYVATNEVIQ